VDHGDWWKAKNPKRWIVDKLATVIVKKNTPPQSTTANI
jgi:hypothetical protein